MRVFKNKWFAKFASKEGIGDDKLVQAVMDADAGNIDADYGGGVIKQRIARQNEGKSGGYRTIILYRKGDRTFFVYGFAKKDQDNISKDDERDFKKLAKIILYITEEKMETMLNAGVLEEIKL